MRTLLLILCGLALAAASCNSIGINAPTPVPGLVNTIVVETAGAASTATAAAAPPPTATPTVAPPCKDGAALVEDAANAAGTSLLMGAKFTKTWQLRNTGTCTWHGYSIVFVSGERMGAPDSVPVADTAPNSTVTVSLDLVSPANAGDFSGSFELHDSSGEPLGINDGKSLAANIAVADNLTPTPLATAGAGESASGPVTLPVPPPDCKYVKSATYPGEIMDLINKARAEAKPPLPPLTFNAKLAVSAQAHSTDMACNNYLEHAGRDKSTIHQRVVAAGYTPSFSEEMIYGSGYPQDAFNWWMGDPPHQAVILDPRVTEFGVGYAYLPKTQYGGYYTVDLGSP